MNRDFRRHGKVVYTQRPSKLIVPSHVTEVADKRAREIIALIVRGLYQYYLGVPLPKDALFWIWRLRTKEQIEVIANDITAYSGKYHRGAFQRVGDGTVFSCRYVEMFAVDHEAIWQLTFYDNVVFGILTNPVRITNITSE